MGTPEFAIPALGALIRSPYRVVAVCTQPDKPAGRTQQFSSPPAKKLAAEYKIPVIQPCTLKSVEVVKELASFEPELLVVAAYGYILPEAVLSLPKFGCLNIHPSLLPRHRGPSPVVEALLCGDSLTGVTIMLVDTMVDNGPILSQREVGISPQDTAGSLTSRLANAGAELLMETLPGWIEGNIEPKPQAGAKATYSRLITSKDGQIEWRLAAEELQRRVMAFDPWPGSYTRWQGKRLKIRQAISLGVLAGGEIGEVVALPPASPVEVGVVTGEGILGLWLVQLEGKREMPVADFIRGHRDFVGSALG